MIEYKVDVQSTGPDFDSGAYQQNLQAVINAEGSAPTIVISVAGITNRLRPPHQPQPYPYPYPYPYSYNYSYPSFTPTLPLALPRPRNAGNRRRLQTINNEVNLSLTLTRTLTQTFTPTFTPTNLALT